MRQRFTWILPGIFFLILAVVFVFIFREPIRDYIVAPLVKAYWNVRRIWRSQEPDIIWTAFLMGIVLVMLMTFPPLERFLDSTVFKNSARARDPRIRYTDAAPDQGGRLDFWVREVEQIYQSRASNRFTVIELKKLILDQIAFRENFPTRTQAEWWLNEHPERIPEDVWLLFHPETQERALPKSTERRPARMERRTPSHLRRRLKSILNILVAPPPAALPVATGRKIDAIIAYLERPSESVVEEAIDLKARSSR
jgi:hypothetical protein